VTVLELVMASTLLLVVLATALSGLGSSMQTGRYATERDKSLADLRIMAAVFSKDARQATKVTTASASQVVMDTYVNGTIRNVTWTALAGKLTRTVAGAGGENRVYLVDLTTTAVFSYYDETDPARVTRIRLAIATRPLKNHPAVEILSDAELRNAA
jgi:hypothetical protein